MLLWVIFFALDVLFWVWIIYWGGAEWLQGTLRAGFFIDNASPTWSADGIKLFAWISLIASVIWFVMGIFNPEFRF